MKEMFVITNPGDNPRIRTTTVPYPEHPLMAEIEAWKKEVCKELVCSDVLPVPRLYGYNASDLFLLLGDEVQIRMLVINDNNDKGWYNSFKGKLVYGGVMVAGPCFDLLYPDLARRRFAGRKIYKVDTVNRVVYIADHINIDEWETKYGSMH